MLVKGISVTRFGEISLLWQNIPSLGQFWEIISCLFGNILGLRGQILYAIRQISIDINGQVSENNRAIWSQWTWYKIKIAARGRKCWFAKLWLHAVSGLNSFAKQPVLISTYPSDIFLLFAHWFSITGGGEVNSDLGPVKLNLFLHNLQPHRLNYGFSPNNGQKLNINYGSET